jgi:hypothetical protein
MKQIALTHTQRDVLLFKALIRKVFPQPKKGEMFISLIDFSQDMNAARFIYLKNNYYEALYNAILEAEQAGKFSGSNAEEHWLGLIDRFEAAIEVADLDYSNLKEWES